MGRHVDGVQRLLDRDAHLEAAVGAETADDGGASQPKRPSIGPVHTAWSTAARLDRSYGQRCWCGWLAGCRRPASAPTARRRDNHRSDDDERSCIHHNGGDDGGDRSRQRPRRRPASMTRRERSVDCPLHATERASRTSMRPTGVPQVRPGLGARGGSCLHTDRSGDQRARRGGPSLGALAAWSAKSEAVAARPRLRRIRRRQLRRVELDVRVSR